MDTAYTHIWSKVISIHALRKESDATIVAFVVGYVVNFNPRSP